MAGIDYIRYIFKIIFIVLILDYNHRPLNREYRDGKLYYFSDEEEIALEKSFVAAPPTKCWPRDWLPKDINETRLLSVDYDTFVSHWSSVKPVESLGYCTSIYKL